MNGVKISGAWASFTVFQAHIFAPVRGPEGHGKLAGGETTGWTINAPAPEGRRSSRDVEIPTPLRGWDPSVPYRWFHHRLISSQPFGFGQNHPKTALS